VSALPASDPLSDIFAALADPTRRDMVARLCDGDATVTELAEPYDVSIQAISKHLKVLEGAGLVTRTQVARTRPVHLDAEVFELMTKWIERFRRRAEARYRRLDQVLAELPDDIGPVTQPPEPPPVPATQQPATELPATQQPATQQRATQQPATQHGAPR
jgi:DNA-binding transcriptional ArsR family regulator